jgi:hypothetical protein
VAEEELLAFINQNPTFVSSATVREKCDWAGELLLETRPAESVSSGVLRKLPHIERSTVKWNWVTKTARPDDP